MACCGETSDISHGLPTPPWNRGETLVREGPEFPGLTETCPGGGRLIMDEVLQMPVCDYGFEATVEVVDDCPEGQQWNNDAQKCEVVTFPARKKLPWWLLLLLLYVVYKGVK